MGKETLLRLLILVTAGAILFFSGCDELVTEVNNIEVDDPTLGERCLYCHSDDNNLIIQPKGQWLNSQHASSELIESAVMLNGEPKWTNECGPTCHTNEGFVNFATAFADGETPDTNISRPSVIGCFTCHMPHTGAFSDWDADTLRFCDTTHNYQLLGEDRFYIDDAKNRPNGRSQMCVHCHQSTTSPPFVNDWDEVTLDATWGPHYSPQANVVSGTAGYQFGQDLDTLLHSSNLFRTNKYQHGCLACHYGTGIGYDFGEHTFRIEDNETGEQYVENCNATSCHVGDAIVTDIYTSSPVLFSMLTDYVIPIRDSLVGRGYLGGDFVSLPVGTRVPARAAQVLYNYLTYQFDGSHGIHNPRLMNTLLAFSLARWDSVPPVPAFAVSDTLICVGTPVSFTSESMGNVDSLQWDFGDDEFSSNPDTVHTYISAGTYTVTLRTFSPAKLAGGEATEVKSDLITVVGPPEPAFAMDTTAGECSFDVTFTDESEFGDTVLSDPASWTWEWRFHDGSADSVAFGSTAVHTFNHPGPPAGTVQYGVTLIVGSGCGTSSLTKDTVISVDPCPL